MKLFSVSTVTTHSFDMFFAQLTLTKQKSGRFKFALLSLELRSLRTAVRRADDDVGKLRLSGIELPQSSLTGKHARCLFPVFWFFFVEKRNFGHKI